MYAALLDSGYKETQSRVDLERAGSIDRTHHFNRIAVVGDQALTEPIIDQLRQSEFDCYHLTPQEIALRPNVALAFVVVAKSAVQAMECGQRLRSRNYLQPIVAVVAGEVSVIDEVLLLETCADDVVADATLSRVAIARLRADLRRTQQQASVDKTLTAILTFGRLTINAIERSVIFEGRRVTVSPADFDLLWVLSCNAGRTVSREELEMCLRGFNSDESRRFVDTRVFRLRRQFKDQCPLAPARIRSVRSQGYMFSLEDW